MEINNDVLKITELMKKIQPIIVQGVSYFFILLFIYAAISKLLDFENFQVQLAQSPVLTSHAAIIPYMVIVFELIICFLLFFEITRPIGLLFSSIIMSAFTVYIFIILNFSEFVPCSCGGILEKMGWTEHLIFNIFCALIGSIAYIIIRYRNKSNPKKTFAIIITSNFAIITIVTVLFLSSEYLIKNENNFTRRFVPHPIYNEKTINLKADTFYFAGASGDSIYLGNREAPLLIASIFPSFKNVVIDTLSIDDYKLPFKNVVINVNYPFYSISDGTVPVLFEGKFPNKLAHKIIGHFPFYSIIKMASPHHYLFKSTLSANREAVLGSYNSQEDHLKFNTSILEKQIDGIFDTDGNLKLELSQKKLVYTYYYRNQYIITNLELDNKNIGHTIDTISKAQIQVKDLANGIKKMTAPPLEVNHMQALSGPQLFNISKLRGRYESKNRWKEANVIDVYNYSTKTYQYSFYIYHHDGYGIRDFYVNKDYVFILSGDKIIKYKRRL